MKQIIVLRHANWHGQDVLTDEGVAACEALAKTFSPFALVLSSPTNRTRQTARLLSNQPPELEEDANVPSFTEQQIKIIGERRPANPLGIVGVIRSDKNLIPPAQLAGRKLCGLINRIRDELQDDQRALIVTHDGTMAAAEQALKNEPLETIDHSYGELEGYTVDEDLRVRRFTPDG